MNEQQIEALGEWLATVEGLLQRMTNAMERIEQHASMIEAFSGDMQGKLDAIFQAVEGVQVDLSQR